MTTETENFVEQDFGTTLRQIGAMTVLGISGGRKGTRGPNLVLPCGYGYRVEVGLQGNDLYTVRRVHQRGAAWNVKGEVRDVHCEELSEQAYRAGMFRDDWPEGGIA